MKNYPNSRKANIVVQDLETEVLIYDLSINKAYCLNQTAALVYQLCDGKRTVAEISDLISKELKTLVSEDFVWLALVRLKKDNLLENADELTNHFGGLTRREAVKRVGLASMVMLPLISSVVAPSAAMAASGCPDPLSSSIPPNCPVGSAITTPGVCSPITAGNIACNTSFGTQCSSGISLARSCTLATPFIVVNCGCGG